MRELPPFFLRKGTGMILDAKNDTLTLDGEIFDYITFGEGERPLVMIPGISDGFRTVEGIALPVAVWARDYAKDFRVTVFSRRRELPEDYTVRDMAEDVCREMDALGIDRACVLGVSQGGMIAEELALAHPGKIEKLVLAITLGRQNDTVRAAVGHWIELAEAEDYRGIMLDMAELSYTKAHRLKYRTAYGLYTHIPPKESFSRFLTEARACLAHDAWDRLPEITVPTLVLGATDDRIVSGAASRELASRIPGALLHMFEGYSHGAIDEAPDFHEWVIDFFR